ncbi:carbohydrate binding domain-containing protein [Candidatus Poribacteria bacterium]
MLLKVFLVLCLIAAPLLAHAQEEEVINLAPNPSFEQDEAILNDAGWTDWYTWNDPAGAGGIVEFDENEFIDGERSLRVEPKGPVDWHYIVANDGNAVADGKDHTVSFWAKAQDVRPLNVHIKATDNSISFNNTPFTLSTEWAEYTFTFDALKTPVKVEFLCGVSETPFWVDFLNVYEGEYVEGIMPSELAPPGEPVEPAGKLAVRWASLKLLQ